MEITLSQMLAAREERAFRQFSLSREFGLPLVSFCMNIPGPVKDSPLIRRGFLAGVEALDAALTGVRFRKVYEAVTGWEAVYVLEGDAVAIKAITSRIEDRHPLGRLFDMDVLDERLSKLDREAVGGGSRDCIVCGAPGRGCASRRIHSVPQLQAAVQNILTAHFAAEDAAGIGKLALRALIDEVETTPKPGLVDRENAGSHRDMDIHTFYRSAAALEPYFRECARLGMETAHRPPEETFPLLRAAGLEAEKTMFAATGGVNTHKGAIFTMGILCGAAGRLWSPTEKIGEAALFREVAAMTAPAMAQDFQRGLGDTAGGRLYAQRGIRGIRGEAALGLPTVRETGLRAYRKYLAEGLSKNDAGVLALLHLIAGTEDTCLLHRGGQEGAAWAKARTAAMLEETSMAPIRRLDQEFIQKNLSPGGSADLLAAVYFVDGLCSGK